MNSVTYENNILDAIEAVVDHAIENAGYDKTIQATIISCDNPKLGKYTIKYQDVTFVAYSQNTDNIYEDGALVQVLVPGNDMSKEKTILGALDRELVTITDIFEGDSGYDIIGGNVLPEPGVEDPQDYGLCSYITNQSIVLYDANNNINLLHYDNKKLENLIKDSNSLILGGYFRTYLDKEQQKAGKYGLKFTFKFKDNNAGDPVLKEYIVDINQMIGNPYELNDFTRQYGIYEIQNKNFIQLEKIQFFEESFPNQALDKPNDIWVKNIEIIPANKLTDEELSGYYLSLTMDKNNYFDASENVNPIEVIANFRISGKKISNDTPGVEYYWFKENNNVKSDSSDFLYYGKEGWQCLNEVLEYKDDLNTKVFQESNGTFEIKKDWTTCLDTTFKCVVVYNGEAVAEKEFQIRNYAANYTVEIQSTGNITEYFFDNGLPNIAAQLYRAESGEWVRVSDGFCRYVWSYVDNDDNWYKLEETTDLNNQYYQAEHNLQVYEFDLGTVQYNNLTQNQKEHLDSLQATFDAIKDVQRVQGKEIFNIDLTQILNKRTFKCSVWTNINGEWIFVGSNSYEIDNTAIIDDGYYINIINGTQTYEYDSKGGSPAASTKKNPITIQPLSFEIYNGRGTKLNSKAIENSIIRWSLPDNLDKSMLQFEDYIADESGNYYQGNKSISYKIDNYYNLGKTDNTVKLEVRYKNLTLNAKTNFTFVKNGQPGTNGTDLVCIIEPNLLNGDLFDKNPVFFRGDQQLNFVPTVANKWFKVKLYDGSDEITSDQYTIRWSLLLASGGFTIDGEGNCAVVNNPTYSNNADIVQCQITYKSKDFYGTLPIIHATCNKTDFNNINLKKNTGFNFVMYMNDGSKPEYDKTNPFVIEINKTLDGKDINIEEVVGEAQKINEVTVNPLTYVWTPYGTRYVNGIRTIKQMDDVIINNPILTIKKNSQIKNTCILIPAESIDGGCLNSGVQVDISGDQIQNTTLYIPIHMYLNRFGIDSLNGWDGNSIETSNGRILAPQVGAGEKDTNNRFTGVFMGSITNQSDKEIGLMGYNAGQRTIFLDSKTGKAEFGKSGQGKIILDPTHDLALLYSSNYSGTIPTSTTPAADSQGMLIDLTTPQIKFGSGNFEVNSSGHLTAKGGGSIAGWNISDTKLSKGKVGISSDNSVDTNYAFWAGNTTASSAPFSVTFDGALKATSATIKGDVKAETGEFGKGTNKIAIGTTSDNTHSNIHSGSKTTLSADVNGFYIGTNGISLGKQTNYGTTESPNNHSYFEVTTAGALYANNATLKGKITATSGKIGSWNISSGAIKYSDTVYLGSDGSVKFGNFSVNTSGNMTATGANVTGTITTSNITATGGTIGGMKIDEYGIWCNNGASSAGMGVVNHRYAFWAGAAENNTGNAPFHVGHDGSLYASSATIQGKITATDGTIGGWNIYGTEFQKQVGEYTFEIRSDRGASDPALLVYKNQGSSQGYKFYVRPDGYLYATSGSFSGTITGSNIKIGNHHSGGYLDYYNGSGYLVCGTGVVDHPYVSALNVGHGSGGILIRSGGSRTNAGDVIGQIKWGEGLEIASANGYAITLDPGASLRINGNSGTTGNYWIEVGNGSSSGQGWKNFVFTKGILTAVQ